jgi:ABC-2 type transport system permease protein
MSKTTVVMQREFLSTVKRKSYLIVTFGMPFFTALYFGLFLGLPKLYKERSDRSKKPVAIVDLSGVVRPEEAAVPNDESEEAKEKPESLSGGAGSKTAMEALAGPILDQVASTSRFRIYPTREEALEALRAEEIDRVFVIPEDYLATGAADMYQREEMSFSLGDLDGSRGVRRILRRSLLAGELPPEVRARVEYPLDDDAITNYVLAPDGEWKEQDATSRNARMWIPGVFGILLWVSLMTSAGYLLQGVSEEKENRVIEVILSSVRPDRLMLGKLLGLGAAGLLQLFVWIAVPIMAASIIAPAVLAVLGAYLFFACLIFFVLGYLLIGSLMIGTGALGTSARESQQLAAIWSIIAVLPPLATWMLLLEEPNGWLARALGWFPLSAPVTMMIRIGTGQIPLWDVLVAVACLAGGVFLSVRASAALFRLGLLMYGTRPTFKQIIRHLRHA